MRISDWSSDVCSSDLRYFSAIGVRSWKLLEEWLGSEHGTASSPRASRRGLSSDGPRQRRPAGVPRRGGLPAVPRDSGRKLHALRLALLWLLPVAGPLPSGGGDAAADTRPRHAPAQRPLYPGFQPPPWDRRPCLSGPLPGGDGRESGLAGGGLPRRAAPAGRA